MAVIEDLNELKREFELAKKDYDIGGASFLDPANGLALIERLRRADAIVHKANEHICAIENVSRRLSELVEAYIRDYPAEKVK